jgi:hypothetical protein
MHVGDEEMNPFNAHPLQGRLSLSHAVGGDHAIVMEGEQLHELLAYRFLVINDENCNLCMTAPRALPLALP